MGQNGCYCRWTLKVGQKGCYCKWTLKVGQKGVLLQDSESGTEGGATVDGL